MKNHNLFRITILKKLLFFYFFIILISLAFTMTLGQDYIRRKVVSETVSTLKNANQKFISDYLSDTDYNSLSSQDLHKKMKVAAALSECRMMLINTDGKMIADSEVEPNRKKDIKYTRDTSFIEYNFMENSTLSAYLQELSLVVPNSLNLKNNPDVYMIAAQKNTFIYTKISYYFETLLITLFIVSISLLLVFFVIYKFVIQAPLKTLISGAKDLSVGQENIPIKLPTNDEFKELAEILNTLGDDLNKVDDYQRKFVSNISHDFRSPLTSIKGYVQAMLDGIIPPDKQEKYLNVILFESERLTKLTTDLLDVHNFDKDNITLNVKTLDVHTIIQNTINAIEGTADKKNITIMKKTNVKGPLMVSGDPDKIHQVIQNLLDNAIKFSFAYSKIIVSTRTQGDKVYVSVKDSGMGISKEDLTKIWDRFYKTDASRGRDKLGTGLGLAICKEIMIAHKQNIEVVSTEGAGTEFTFTLKRMSNK